MSGLTAEASVEGAMTINKPAHDSDSYETSSSSSGTSDDAPDLKGELGELKKAVKSDQDQIAQVTKKIAGEQQDIGILETGLGDIDQTVKAYTQAIAAAGDMSSLQTFIDHEASMAAAAVGDGKYQLDDVING